MKKRWAVILLIIFLILFLLTGYFFLIIWFISPGKFISPLEREGVALIKLEGTIIASGEGDLLSGKGVSPEKIIEQIKKAEEDSRAKAILLRINSPGGTAAASQEIYKEVKRAKKPVVVSVADIGASGAYWVACGADKIVASPASDIGSIGVILTIPNLQELFKKVGIEYVVITQGKYKDIGNPARPMTEEEKEILRKQAEVIYEQFISDVAEGRKLSRAEVKKLATGLAFLGTEAKKYGLIDELGNFRDAIKLAGKMGKIKGEPEIIEYEVPSLYESLKELFRGSFFIPQLNPIILPLLK